MPDLGGRVAVFDGDNALIGYLGDAGVPLEDLFPLRENDPATFTPGQFVHPHDAIFDHAGNIFVTEWVEQGRVTKLTRLKRGSDS